MNMLGKENLEKQMNRFFKDNLNIPTEKLLNFSLNLIEKNKLLNEDSHKLNELQNNLKLKEINNSNKKMELLVLEKRMKDKNPVNIKNILECYSIILKNNDELLKRRLEQLKERDFNLKKREYILSKIKSNEFKLNQNYPNSDQKLLNFENENKIKSSDKIIDEELIFEEIRNQFNLFKNAKIRILSNDNLSSSQKNKLEVQKNQQIFISKSISPDEKNRRKYSKKHINYKLNERKFNDINRITEENEENLVSKRNSIDKNLISSINRSVDKQSVVGQENSMHKKKIFKLNKSDRLNKITSKEYKSDEKEKSIKPTRNHISSIDTDIKRYEFVEKRVNNDLIKYKKMDENKMSEILSDADKTFKLKKLLKNKSDEDIENSINSKNAKSKGIIRISKNFTQTDKKDNGYRGLARNLSGNKSFDNVRNLGNSFPIDKNFNKNNIININRDPQNEKLNRQEKLKMDEINNNKNNIVDNKMNNINKDILDRLLKEADEDAKKKEHKKIESIQNNVETNIKFEINNPLNNFKIDFNDENLLKISNILANNRKGVNIFEETDDNKSNKNKKSNSLAESLFLLNQNGIFKNKKENLRIQSGININLDEEKNVRNNNSNRNETNSNKRENSFSGKDRKIKDKIIMRDIENEKENIAKKNKRNTVSLGKDIDKKLNIHNLNQIKKDIPDKKNEIKKRNSQSNDDSLVINNSNHSRSSNLNQKQNKNNKFKNDSKNNTNEHNDNKLKNNQKIERFSEESNIENDPVIDKFIKRLEFDNIDKQSSNIIKHQNNMISNQEEINLLLESKHKDITKENDMFVMIENERILKDEIYIQKMINYEDELLIKKPIQFNNEINIEDLKLNSFTKEKQEKSYHDDSNRNNLKQNFVISNSEDKSDKGISIKDNNLSNKQYNQSKNIIEYENELQNSNSQSDLNRNSILLSQTLNYPRGKIIENRKTPFDKLEKNSFDSIDGSYNNSNNTLNKNNNLSLKNTKNLDKDIDNNYIKYNIRNSTKENTNLKIKENLLKEKEMNLKDSLDSSIHKSPNVKYRKSMDDKVIARNKEGEEFNRNQVKNNDNNNNNNNNKVTSNSSNRKSNQTNEFNKQKKDNLKSSTLNSINSADKNDEMQFRNQSNNSKQTKDEKTIQTNKSDNKTLINQTKNDQNTDGKRDSKTIKNENFIQMKVSKDIKDSNSDSNPKINEGNRQLNSNNTTSKDSTDNTISSTKQIKIDSNIVSDINGKYDSCMDDDEDDQKIVDYQEYIKKMKQMALETKSIEDNMRQFANIVQNLVENNK